MAHQKNTARPYQMTFRQQFMVFWIIFLYLYKVSIVLLAIGWSTYYQLEADPSDTDVLIQVIFQRIYSSICDFLVTLTFLYFFNSQ